MPKAIREKLQNGYSYDEPDRMPRNISITNLDIIMYCVAIIGHFVDLALDINVAVRYFLAKKMMEFGWTLAFIMVPAFVNTAVSVRMYSQDKQQDSVSNEFNRRRYLRVFILVLQMAPILRFTDALIYAIKARQAERNNDPSSQRKYYALMLKEDSDAALLRIFECFLEAAPQQLLQTTLLLRGYEELTVHQLISIASSMVSMGWCLAAYQRAIRFAQQDKENMSWVGSTMQTVMHFLIALSRITSIALIAYLYPYWTILAAVIHVIVMTIWLQFFDKSPFCSHSKLCEIAFSFTLGAVYIFTYILPIEGRTRYRYIIYYTICLLQNITCSLLWFYYADLEMRISIFFVPFMFLCVVPYTLGLLIMTLYYSFCHPKVSKDFSVIFKFNQVEIS